MDSTATSIRPTAPATPAAALPWCVETEAVYFVGVGGCGMSGLARMLAARGAIVAGSDRVASDLTESLVESGVAVDFDQDSGHLPERCDRLVVSAAVPPDHPQLLEAQRRGIPIMSYAEALGQLMLARTGISIAGTHGKSTTTAMLAHILIECGLDPSFVVGATCAQIGGGSRTGGETIPGQDRPGLLLAEACEFNRSFHHHRPTIGAILNLEEDHLDIYGSLDAIIEAFHGFARLIPAAKDGGYLLISHDRAHRGVVATGLECAVETIGLSTQADWNFAFDPESRRVTLGHDGGRVAEWTTPMIGEHNAYNSAVAAVLAHRVGAPWERIIPAIESFRGIDRRMQRLGSRPLPGGGEVLVYDDYGHHPTEIDTTLRALRAHEKPDRLVCVFQPHQHSRTRFLLEQFAASFSEADVVIVPHIYFVRDSEAEKQKVSARDLVDRLRQKGVQAMHLYPFEAIVEHLEIVCRPGDLVVVMGAGPVWKVARGFLGQRRHESNGASSKNLSRPTR
ncbi:MAG: UDP-N-acetylmuramate--L-alanine ligase [Phycisphaerales bacterium]